eukprot:Selendium_serpulae@DN5806_c0_g2_i3.p1
MQSKNRARRQRRRSRRASSFHYLVEEKGVGADEGEVVGAVESRRDSTEEELHSKEHSDTTEQIEYVLPRFLRCVYKTIKFFVYFSLALTAFADQFEVVKKLDVSNEVDTSYCVQTALAGFMIQGLGPLDSSKCYEIRTPLTSVFIEYIDTKHPAYL